MIEVTKRDGSLEHIDLNKLHKVVMGACDKLSGVSASEVEMRAHLSFFDGINTSAIQESLIKAAADLICEETPNYQYVAGRLINYHLRKSVYGSHEPLDLFSHVEKVVELGYYDPIFLSAYSKEEFDKLDSYIEHSRDLELTFAAMEQWRGKYLVKDRSTGQIFETPQFAYMLISAFLFHKYPKETRLQYVKDYYDAISEHYISIPTPVLSGARTPDRQFSSCVLIEADDNLDSIFSTAHAVGMYVARKAGIGIGSAALRSKGSKVRNGAVTTTGIIPYFKLWEKAVASSSQGSVRKGSATTHFAFWNLEVEDLLVLKSNKGTDETTCKGMDYSIQLNKLAYKRLVEGGNITLFSPSEVPGLYDAFFEDQEEFERLYCKYEKTSGIRKKKIAAIDLFSGLMQERKETGRIYIMNVDNCNDHSSFSVPVRMSNLCQEVVLPVAPFKSVHDGSGEIALCILSALNWGKINSPEDFAKPAALAVRALDELIDMQEYILPAAKKTILRRSLGIGVTNFAYWMAKNNLRYQDIDADGLARVDEFIEAQAYYLTKASVDLAEEKGACGYYNQTKYHEGLLPIDTYNKNVDALVENVSRQPWGELRERMKVFGIRNSTIMACMPSETSSQINNSTNGIEPPKALVSSKTSKEGTLAQVVPEIRRLKNKYDLSYAQKSPRGYLKIMAVLQKYIDQAISVNTTYNPKFYPDNEIPLSEMLSDLLFHYKHGGKTLYYFNTADGSGEVEIIDEADCEACKL